MIHLKSALEIDRIRASCRIAAEAMLRVEEALAPGVTTLHLDQIADRYIRSQGAVASALGYRGFPRSICVSVNDEVVHGIPGDRVLQEGDILAVDIAVKKDGFHGDMNVTMKAGCVPPKAQRLLDATRQSLEEGLAACTPGQRLGDIGYAIQSYVEARGFSIVRAYCGHGIGRNFHEEPQLLHYGKAGTGRRLQNGMVSPLSRWSTRANTKRACSTTTGRPSRPTASSRLNTSTPWPSPTTGRMCYRALPICRTELAQRRHFLIF